MTAKEADKIFDDDQTEADRLGVPLQPLIKVWIADRLAGTGDACRRAGRVSSLPALARSPFRQNDRRAARSVT